MEPRALNISRLNTDVLVLGGGLAGYRAAVAARERGASVTMAFFARGASPYIIGCNSPIGHADDRDRPEIFFDDMVRGGYGLNDRRLVQIMSTESIDAQRELSALGVPFPTEQNRITQRHLSGNTYPRSLFIPEGTGRVVLEYLSAHAEKIGVSVLTGLKVVDLLNDGGDVVGALLWDRHSRAFSAITSRAVVLAMGGIGRIYSDSTYPADIGSDSYGLALKHGACLIDMEFVQFEPVVTVWPEGCRGMEMPTAMLGDGAHLINAKGERFMFRYNPEYGEKQIEKARMALCVQTEIDEGRGLSDDSVIFDTTVLPPERLESYKTHVRRLRTAGVDPLTTPPHVRPASHSQMGGAGPAFPACMPAARARAVCTARAASPAMAAPTRWCSVHSPAGARRMECSRRRCGIGRLSSRNRCGRSRAMPTERGRLACPTSRKRYAISCSAGPACGGIRTRSRKARTRFVTSRARHPVISRPTASIRPRRLS
jgi:succinate dehydrogenase/fumarate reductase flavoprotein subunit